MNFKIKNAHENPLDILLTSLSSSMNPIFKVTGHTPNIITTYSFLTGILSIFFLYRGNLALFSILFFLSYYFDCCDGSFAREYGMESRFGDLYDHITDVVVFSLIVLVVFVRYRTSIDLLAIVVFAGFLFLTMMHLGCQQCNCNDCDGTETLDSLRTLCADRSHIAWTRYFGNGTFIAVIIGLVWYLDWKKSI